MNENLRSDCIDLKRTGEDGKHVPRNIYDELDGKYRAH